MSDVTPKHANAGREERGGSVAPTHLQLPTTKTWKVRTKLQPLYSHKEPLPYWHDFGSVSEPVWMAQKIFPQLGFDCRTLKLAATCYIDYFIYGPYELCHS